VVVNEMTFLPFALSLSKGCFVSIEGQGFDKLSPNGVLYG
jgi:hypothetical protein